MEQKSNSASSSTSSAAAAQQTQPTTGVVRKKYESCKNFREKGFCKYGDRCLFAHGDHELTKRGSEEETQETKPPAATPLEVVAEVTIESTKDSTQV